MLVRWLSVALAVDLYRVTLARSPSDCIGLSVGLMQYAFGLLLFNRMMDLRIHVGWILNFDDINVCHVLLPF